MKKLITLILVAVLMISFAVVANAAVGTVVKANKVDKAPNLDEIDESWGEPVITVTSDTPSAELYKYWNEYRDTAGYEHEGTGPNGRQSIQPENNPFDLYVCWDDKYIYVGITSPDHEICGSVEAWRGDGVQFWLQPLEALTKAGRTHTGLYGMNEGMTEEKMLEYYNTYRSMCCYYWTLDFDDYSVSSADAAAECEKTLFIEDDLMQATIRIPLTNFGLNGKKTNLHGTELGTAVIRSSSKSSFDEGYAGWLSWGKYFDYGTAESMNTIVLVDPAQGDVTPSTEAPATEAPATEAPATEAPATEAPATEAPATEAPATEAPATEAPATEAPATEAPATEAPATEAPATEAPATEAPATEAPATEAPATEAPTTEAPVTEAPATEAPATEAPATEAPATEAPKVEEPVEKNNTGLIIAIVAVVVVVGAGLGIALGKKKK